MLLTLTLWVSPFLVSSLTKFSLSGIVYHSKEVLPLGFATGNNFVILAIAFENVWVAISRIFVLNLDGVSCSVCG